MRPRKTEAEIMEKMPSRAWLSCTAVSRLIRALDTRKTRARDRLALFHTALTREAPNDYHGGYRVWPVDHLDRLCRLREHDVGRDRSLDGAFHGRIVTLGLLAGDDRAFARRLGKGLSYAPKHRGLTASRSCLPTSHPPI